MYVYMVADCNTENCGTVQTLTYLGEKGKTPASVEYWMSCPLMTDCAI